MDPETASAVPRSPVSCTITVRGHQILQDKPPASGGTDEGPMASELLLGALLACQLGTFAKVKAKRGSAVDVERIDAECHFDTAGDIERIALVWSFVGGDAAEHATLMRLTERVCTISRALKVPVASSSR